MLEPWKADPGGFQSPPQVPGRWSRAWLSCSPKQMVWQMPPPIVCRAPRKWMGDTQAAAGNVLQTVLVQWIKKEKNDKKENHPTSYYSSLFNDEQFLWVMSSQQRRWSGNSGCTLQKDLLFPFAFSLGSAGDQHRPGQFCLFPCGHQA